ncbi:MAG: hypothetical protein IPP46_04720 [Bacteroidetes bacterium]|nr:hypothetical protein [Bacteroidota bacterium]
MFTNGLVVTEAILLLPVLPVPAGGMVEPTFTFRQLVNEVLLIVPKPLF